MLSCGGIEELLVREKRAGDLKARMQEPGGEDSLLLPFLVFQYNTARGRAALGWVNETLERLKRGRTTAD
jgi:hypothetical protein